MQLSPHAPRVMPWTGAQIASACAIVIACAFAPASCLRGVEPRDASADPRPPGSALLYEPTLDANVAAREDFESLPGIGPKKAAAIIARRERSKGFCAIEEVRRAASVSGKTWERIAPLIRVSRSPRCSSSSRE